ncbi:hypothetical protein TKK_0009326 [Trichogramma kaykai]|uniref:Cytochrome P450 n=1 Tax=Trichogramma kaykai TaxID=54128 RepID=A0ABD2X3D8_9HYME
MAPGILEILTLVGIAVLGIYYYLTSNFDFWKKRGVVGPQPQALFGNFKDILFGKAHIALLVKKFYDAYPDEPMIGMYAPRGKPILVLKDPDCIKDVLIKDFNVFSNRGLYVNKERDPLNQNLVNLEHERWRPLRNKLSPAFTSGKLREMFYLMTDCADHFERYIVKNVVDRDTIECRELAAKFTTQSIGVCAFGLDTKSLDDENSEFRKCGRELFETNFANVARRTLQEFMPKLYELLGPFKYSRAVLFFARSTKETIDYRKKNGVRRNDFVDILMDIQAQPDKLKNIDFDEKFLAGQALVFFAAGFETSATTISNTFYELALNPDIQNKLRAEIQEEIKNNDGKLTYDGIKKMKYLDMVMKETLRKYPPGSVLVRKSGASYTFSSKKVQIPKDITVMIPVWAIQRDPQIYPDPEKYDPERFSEENEKSRHPMNYLPFGDGPHNCIGSRFANYQTKIGIIVVINKFKLEVCDKTCIPYIVEPRSLVPSPIGGIHLKLSKI